MALGGCGGEDAQTKPSEPAPATTSTARDAARQVPDRFDEQRAFRELVRQTRLGPRPAGSETLRTLAGQIERRLPNGRQEPVGGGLYNVVGSLRGTGRAIVLAAHYDTKDIPGFVGANDGAGGTATVLEVARVLRKTKRPPGAPPIRFVFFDGEESPDDSQDFYATGLRGSKAYLEAHRDELRMVVVVDFVADRDLSLPREAGSHEALWERLRQAAQKVGYGRYFPDAVRPEILDDHTPFMRQGIPAIDLIDFDYPYWHTTEDTADKTSAKSLDVAGEALVQLLRTLR